MEVMNRATAKLDLQWRHEKGEIARGRLDVRFQIQQIQIKLG